MFVLKSMAFAALFVSAMAACGGGGGSSTSGDSRTLWIFKTQRGLDFAAPALSADEATVYFGTSYLSSDTEDHGLYALDSSTGVQRWKYHVGEAMVRSAATVDSEGAIYFVLDHRNVLPAPDALDELIKVNAAGEFLWRFDLNPSRLSDQQKGSSSIAIGTDGTIYAPGDTLYALNPNGTVKWTSGTTDEVLRSSPVVAKDGSIFLGFHNFSLKAFDPEDGSILWSLFNVPRNYNFGSPSIGPDGTIYLGTDDGVLFAVNPGGWVEWAYDTATTGYSCTIRSSPAIGPNGSIYFGTSQGSSMPRFYALNSDGTLKWYFVPTDLPPEFPVGHGDFYSSPAIGQDGTIYTGHEFGRVYAFDPMDGAVKWTYDTYEAFTGASPTLKSDGTLLIGRLYGNVYALKTDGGGLNGASPWPKSRGDSRNTGNMQVLFLRML